MTENTKQVELEKGITAGLTKMSTAYQTSGGNIKPATLYEYTKLAKRVSETEKQSQSDKEFLVDYFTTMCKIENNKAKLGEGLTEIGKELIQLPSSSSNTIKISELVIKPETFDGERPKPRRWIQDYNEAIIANGWSDEIAIKYLPTFLSRSAKDWYFTEVKPFLVKEARWYQVYNLFVENYLGEKDYESLAKAVENAHQRPGETISNFIPRLRRLMLLLTPGMSELEQLRNLKNKLRPEYRSLLALVDPQNLRALRECCLKIEAGFPEKQSNFKRTENRIKANSKKFVKGKYTASRQTSTKEDTNHHPTDARREVVCYKCNKKGHYSKDCWSKSTPKMEGNKVKRVNLVDEVELPNEILTIQHQETKPKRVENIKPKTALNLLVGGEGELLKHIVYCNDREFNAIFDTGAYISVVDEDLVRVMGWKIDKPGPRLVGANGKALISRGTTSIKFHMRIGYFSKVKTHKFALVKDLNAPILVGLELMRLLKIKIDLAEDKLEFSKRNLKAGIRTADEEIIPGRSKKVIKGQVNTVGSIMVIPQTAKQGIYVANSISKVSNNLTDILVMNPTNHFIKLKSGLQLGSYESYKGENDNEKESPSKSIEGKYTENVNLLTEVTGLTDKIRIGDNLDETKQVELKEVLISNIQAFSLNGEIGKTGLHKHSIELLPNAKPIVEPLRRRAQVQIEETRKQVRELIENDIIEESNSPWASAYVLAKKRNGEYRLCIDFRRLNEVTKKVAYPLPNIDECLETLSGKKYFSLIDFKSGYWQIEMADDSKELTAFRTEDGQFQFKRMPFGLTNAPASFQKTINTMLIGLRGMELQVFVDDICIASKNWKEHLVMLNKTLRVIIESNLKIKADKCVFAAASVTFLGHVISKEGIQQDPEKLKALRELPAPKDAKEVKRILGMLSYYRKFVPNFASISEPLTKLTRKNVDFQWQKEEQEAFQTLVNKLCENATLAHFNFKDPLLLKTDASKAGIAGMLLQKQEGDWRLITCCSRRLSSSEINYGITDLEGLAVVYAVDKLRNYLLGRKFQISVDHCALCVLNSRTPKSARLRRWAIILSEFEFEIVYTKGNLHCDIDCLSRAPVDNETDPFLEDKVYLIQPFDRAEWILSYKDEESKRLFQSAFEKEGDLRLVEDVIYKGELLYVPESKRAETVRLAHYTNMNAHAGINATIAKLKENYWWEGMRESVTSVINQCSTCLFQKPDRNRPQGQMNSFQIFSPGEQVAIDLIEKLTESHNGNQFIIVCIDMFTRFVDAKAVPDKGAPTFTQYLSEYCGRFGVPHNFLTDNSTTFCNELTSQVMKSFGANHVKSTPYHSQGNAVVERVNQTLEEKIRIVLDDPLQDKNWDLVLPVATLAINTTFHSSIGCTPYEMVFGRRAPLQEKQLTFKANPYDSHAKLIKLYMEKCHADAIAIQSLAQERAKEFYDTKRRVMLYKLNDFVTVKTPSRSSKLSPKFSGVYKVVGIEKDILTLENTSNGKTIHRHANDVRATKLPQEL